MQKANKIVNNSIVILKEYLDILWSVPTIMPKVSLDMPAQILEDLKLHVGDDGKFVSVADAIRTACRKMLDQLDLIDARHGRMEGSE